MSDEGLVEDCPWCNAVGPFERWQQMDVDLHRLGHAFTESLRRSVEAAGERVAKVADQLTTACRGLTDARR